MVYVKSQISDAIRSAIAANPPALVKERLEAERARLKLPEDQAANQDAAYQYMLWVQDNPTQTPDEFTLQSHLVWIAANLTTMPDIVLGTFKSVIHNVVGSSAHNSALREKFQRFKRQYLGEYDDNDPVEAVVFGGLNALAAAQTPEAVAAALATLQGVDSLVPTSVSP